MVHDIYEHVINWYSKKQSTIETSVFGTEFVAMKDGVDTLHDIEHKLRMMGIQISGPTDIYEDNMLVIHTISKADTTLKKNCNMMACYAIHESVAMKESFAVQIRLENNLADLLMKVITGKEKKYLKSLVLYYIYYEDT